MTAVIQTTNTTADIDASPTTVNMPSGIVAGDLLIVICSADVANTITQSGGTDWTKLQQTNNSTIIGLVIFAKIAAGGDSLTLTSSGSNDIACVSLRITGHGVSNVSTDITRGTAATGTSATPDPPNCNPGTAKDYLWIECFAADDDDNTATYWSTNYSAVAQIESAASTTSSLCAVARRNLNASSENPGVMAMALSEEWVAQTLAIPPSTASQVTQTWNIRHDLASSVEEVWTLRSDLASKVEEVWSLRHDLAESVSRVWNLRHDLVSAVEQIWNLRHDMAGSVEEIWTLRHDLAETISRTWNIRHDLSSAITQTWNLRHDLSSTVEQIWNLRHDLASSIERVWNIRHDLSSYVSQVWNFRHNLISSVAPVVEFAVRGFKADKRPQLYIPTVKSNTIKFRIPIFWVNKLNIKLDLPVWYQIVYEKKLFTHSISEKKIKIQ